MQGPPLIKARPVTMAGQAAATAIHNAALRSPATAPSSASRQAMVEQSSLTATGSRHVSNFLPTSPRDDLATSDGSITVTVDRSTGVCGQAHKCWQPFSTALSVGTADDPPICGYQLDSQKAPPFASFTSCDLAATTYRSSCCSTPRGNEAGISSVGEGDQAGGWGGGDGDRRDQARPNSVPPLRLERLAQSKAAAGGVQQKQLLRNLQDLRDEAAGFEDQAHHSVFT